MAGFGEDPERGHPVFCVLGDIPFSMCYLVVLQCFRIRGDKYVV